MHKEFVYVAIFEGCRKRFPHVFSINACQKEAVISVVSDFFFTPQLLLPELAD